jgi:hypothetical protein
MAMRARILVKAADLLVGANAILLRLEQKQCPGIIA